MTKSISTPVSYQFHNNNVRIIEKDGEPWFVAKDVCDILGIKNSRDALSRLDDDEKDAVGLTDTIGRDQETAIVNEFGLYNLILSSRKKEPKEFKRWLTHEVVPTLFKTGSYSMHAQPQLDAPSTKADREPLTNIVNTLVSVAPISHRDAWHMVKAELKTSKAASEFTVSEVHRAIDFAQSRVEFYTTRVLPRENDVHAGIITDMAMQGVSRFDLVISIGENVTQNDKLIMRQFKAEMLPPRSLKRYSSVKTPGAVWAANALKVAIIP